MEETIFTKALGDSPKVKVMDMLLTGRELDFSISDIAHQAGIGRSTFYRMLDSLLCEQIIISSRRIGHIQLYKINLANPIVKKLAVFYDSVTADASAKEIKRQQKKQKLIAASV